MTLRATAPTAPTTPTTGRLPATPPFDLGWSRGFVASFAPCAAGVVLTPDGFASAVALDDRVVGFRLRPAPGAVEYELATDGVLDDALHAAARRALADHLGLEDDLTDFLGRAAEDDAFAPIAARLAGLHHLRFPTLAQACVWFVLAQRTPPPVSLRLQARIVAELGATVVLDGRPLTAFPTLETLAALEPHDWDRLVGGRKADYLLHVTRGVADLGRDRLVAMPYGEAVTRLRRLRGVGEFTAAAILLRGLGRMDDVPLDQPGFGRDIAAVYGPDADHAALRSHYGPHLGYWMYYLKNRDLSGADR